MILPPIVARVKQHHNFIRKRVNPRKVRSLSQVAPVASQGQVTKFVRAPVLSGNDMLDVVREVAVLLAEETVLATIAGPPADEISSFGVGHGRTFEASLR